MSCRLVSDIRRKFYGAIHHTSRTALWILLDFVYIPDFFVSVHFRVKMSESKSTHTNARKLTNAWKCQKSMWHWPSAKDTEMIGKIPIFFNSEKLVRYFVLLLDINCLTFLPISYFTPSNNRETRIHIRLSSMFFFETKRIN